jgi:hypothetical protein
MVTDDKVKVANSLDIDNNLNTRDQARAGIVLIVITVVLMWLLISIGVSNAPKAQEGSEQSGSQSAATSGEQSSENAPVQHISGFLQLPGTINEPQHFIYTTNTDQRNTLPPPGSENTTTTTTTGAATPPATK